VFARQRLVEDLSIAHQRACEQLDATQRKAEGQKARIRVLEGENSRMRTQLKLIVDKADTDDALIEELKSELLRVRETAKSRTDSLVKQRVARVSAKALVYDSIALTLSGRQPERAARLRPISTCQRMRIQTWKKNWLDYVTWSHNKRSRCALVHCSTK
jgi:hypothetical protein